MLDLKAICPVCDKSFQHRYNTYWICGSCERKYPCVSGIPKLYTEELLGKEDKSLRDNLYDTSLGWIYNFLNPFILLPVRPIKISIKYWMIYFLLVSIVGFFLYQTLELIIVRGFDEITNVDVIFMISLTLCILFFLRNPLYAYLLILAIPVKISTSIRRFKPVKSHAKIHSEFQEEFLQSNEKLQMLDIASGSGTSLYRHGWLNLNASFTAVDLSTNMLIQGLRLMTKKQEPINYVLCDATKLPFESETFNIVTNYGAVNAFTDPKSALAEMVRVTKKGGKILFLDEQEYESSTWLENLYFKHVLTYHNTIVGCPVDMLPTTLEDIQVHQVYEFVYICTARKKK